MLARACRLMDFAGLAVAVLIVSATAVADDETAGEAPTKTERPTTLDRPIGVKSYFLSPPPERLSPSEEQRAVDYHSGLQGEIKRLERRQRWRGDRRGFNRMQTLRRERARIGRIIRR